MNRVHRIAHKFDFRKRLEPDIFIAGFQKCGTTSLYDYLAQLPDLLPGKVKEKNDLSFERFSKAKYLQNFPLYKKNKRTFCGSHQLTYFPLGLKRLKEHFSNAKILLICRDPVDRAYSLYQHNSRHSDDDKFSFDHWIETEMRIIENLNDIHDPIEVFEKTKWRGRPAGSWDMQYRLSTGMAITRGLYINYINQLKKLGLSFHILSLEELSKGFESEFIEILEYLGIDRSHIDFVNHRPLNQGKYTEKMSDSAEKILTEFFAPFNQELFNAINKEFPWRSS